MADEMKAAPLPWRKNEYGDVLDASGNRVALVGFAMVCGYVPAEDERQLSTDAVLRAINAFEPMSAALEALRADVANEVGLEDADKVADEVERFPMLWGSVAVPNATLVKLLRAIHATEWKE